MEPRAAAPSAPFERWPYLWLALGAALNLFAMGRWIVPLAVWLAPLFVLRFARAEKATRGLLLYAVVMVPVGIVAWRGMVPLPERFFYLFMVVMVVVAYLPYMYDRLIVPRFLGFAATLVLPLAWTTKEYLTSLASPMASFASVAYTQYDNLPLMQLLSVTGLWGLTFLVIWFASVVNWAWERNFEWQKVRRGLAVYAGILGAVFFFGEIRLTLFPPQSSAVRVATFTEFDYRANRLPRERAAFHEAAEKIQADYLARTEREARAGARLISWPEGGVPVEKEEEVALIERASQVARQEQIYLFLSLYSKHGPGQLQENKVVLVGPTGNVLWHYLKAKPVPGDPDVAGDGHIRFADTPYGRLSAAICYDLDFPSLMRQAGRNGADVLFAPTLDWKAIKEIHARLAVFRAVENGFSLVRPASNGLSLAVDYQGRVLAAMDHFTARDRVLIAQVPTRGVTTLYSRLGDVFPWLCVAGFVAFVALAVARRRALTGAEVILAAGK